QIPLAGLDRVSGLADGLEAGRAEPVHRGPRHLDRKAGEQRGHPRHVAVVLAGGVRAAEHDVVESVAGHTVALHHGLDDAGRHVVGPHRREPAAVSPDRRSNGVDDYRFPGFPHAAIVTTLAPWAAGTIPCSASAWW